MSNKNFSKWLSSSLKQIKKSNLHRNLIEISSSMGPEIIINKKKFYQFASNNYLGLTTNTEVVSSSIKASNKFGVGTGGSRLVTGTSALHNKLEADIAKFKKTEDAIVFSSGYLANLGTISSLMSKGDIIFSDELNHASLIDGSRLSKSKIVIYKHSDMLDLEKKLKRFSSSTSRKMILTDTVFSMDGDIAPLDKIVFLCKKYNCLSMVDEAHATGVLGKTGSGATELFGIQNKIDICMGTLSKAVGSVGGYIAGSNKLIDFLKNRARSFIFDTSLPGSALEASIQSIRIIKEDRELRKKLFNNIHELTDFLKSSNFSYVDTSTPIIPIIIGDEKKTLKTAEFLFKNQIYIPAVRPPSVPKGESRIRITLMANHESKHIKKLIRILDKLQRL
jgi:8-amino-7-oxononanoate synthase